MAIEIVSGNLNLKGDAGQFEADPSTWGFGSTSVREIGRSSYYHSGGLHSMYCNVLVGGYHAFFSGANGAVNIVAGKKYLAKAKVRVTEGSEPGEDNVIVHIESFLGIGAGQISNVTYVAEKTIADIKDADAFHGNWFDIETRFDAIATTTLNDLSVALVCNVLDADGDELFASSGLGAALYVDEFEIYEYIIVPDDPTCTLAIDVPGTVVVNETAPSANDASITVATTGGTGTIEKRINGGAWQTSDLFAGLNSGLHTVEVREQDNPSCTDTQFFAVNSAGVSHDFTIAVTHETVSGANNGQLVADVTGTGGPFTFSLNGDAYQGSNAFPDLAPGFYYVLVKNAAGDIVVKSATVNAGAQSFDKIFFSKNPITYGRAASSGWELLSNYRLYDDVRVEDVTGSSEYNSKLKVDQPPGIDGNVLFSVRRAFRDVLRAIPPTLNHDSLVRLTDRIKFFKHYTGELQDDEITPEVITASNPFVVMLGGLSTSKFPLIDFFGAYMLAYKKFMTWAPVVKQVDRVQEDYLNFWIYDVDTTLIKRRIKVYYDDSTDTTSTVETIAAGYGQLYQVPAGPANCGVLAINPAKNAIKYELSILDQGDAVISEVRTYMISKVKHPLARYFMILNSLGGYEVHRFNGVTQLSADFEGSPFEKYLAPDYTSEDVQLEMNAVVMQNKGSFSSGYIEGPLAAEWLSYLRDLVKTTRLFDVTTGARVPLMITSRSMTWKEDQNYERFVRIEAQEAFIDESFTPEDVGPSML